MSYRTARTGLALTAFAHGFGALGSLAVGVVLDNVLWRLRAGEIEGYASHVRLLSAAGQVVYVGATLFAAMGVFLFASVPVESRARGLALASGFVEIAALVLSLVTAAASALLYRLLASGVHATPFLVAFYSFESLVAIGGTVMLLLAMQRVARRFGGWFPTWMAALAVALALLRLGVYVVRSMVDAATPYAMRAAAPSLALSEVVTIGARVLALGAAGLLVALIALAWKAIPPNADGQL